MSSRKKILITGSTGFIGSFLVEEAIRRGYEVYAGMRATSNKQFLPSQGVTLFQMDFSDADKLKKVMKEGPHFDFIIHNAGLTKTPKQSEYYSVNSQNTKKFVDAIRESGKKPEKFILISSLAAYGPGDPSGCETILLTGTPKPVTTYGKSKLEAESHLLSVNDLPYLIFRPTAVYGPREKDLYLYMKLINRHVETYIGQPIPYLTFIYVKDLVKAVFLGIESTHVNKAWFVGDGNLYTGKEFAKFIRQHLGNKKTLALTVPLPLVKGIASILEFFYGFAGRTPILNYEKINELSAKNWNCDVKPIQQDLNFKADYDLNEGIKETIAWYKREKWL
jgi:nucleoside-diphosphate-sugar epimerase